MWKKASIELADALVHITKPLQIGLKSTASPLILDTKDEVIDIGRINIFKTTAQKWK